MSLPPGRQFAIEIHPADWRFPAEKSWVAGWIRPEADRVITDVRARLHHRIILGLASLPHPASAGKNPAPAGLSGSGFSFFLSPQLGATLLRLEARDDSGQWTEFFRTKITAAPDAPAPAPVPNLNQSLRRLVTILIQQCHRSPQPDWDEPAEELVASLVAEPLEAHPNVPFVGALEEPREIGRLRYGRIPVTGWLAHPTARITRLSAVIDPLPATSLPYGLARQDLAGVFPSLDGQANSAFVGEIALPAELAAPVLLKIFAELDHGENHLVFARRFTPHQHGGTGQMVPLVPGLTFARAIWALHRAAGRYGLPRHGLIRAARVIWADYKAIPAFRPNRKFPLPKNIPGKIPTAPLREAPACTLIAPADDMCMTGAEQYYHIGREALTQVQQAVARSGHDRIEAILDLPCGYGRVARWFRTAYPAAQLTVCDTQGRGVAFCVEHLRATGVPATGDGGHWASLPGPYDIIWCGSLLTHFDRNQWLIHLQRFAERLTPHGVLVFTSHGLLAQEKLQSGEKDYGLPPEETARLRSAAGVEGFGYVNYPDSPGYGISIAQPGWISELIARETELHLLEYREAAWDQHQDVVVCTRRPPVK
jgi:SAM-dependent methyltransferase